MASTNTRRKPTAVTHEGAPTYIQSAEEQLKRTVMSCMLWEKNFYEDGVSIADRIVGLIPKVKPEVAYQIAVDARNKSKLRHVPLLIARTMAGEKTHKGLVGKLLSEIIQRPDELTEMVSLYWSKEKQPLSAQVKKGLAKAFKKFNEYSLAKYNRQDKAVKLRDVLFLSHPKPDNDEQQALWNRLVKGELAIPDTWEVALSAGKDKKATWERLIDEKKLGGLAVLRNMRNMIKENVTRATIKKALEDMKTDRILPFRFIASARYAPDYESELEQAMYKCLDGKDKIKGHTIFLVDISGSMDVQLSAKSDMMRTDAAFGLAILGRELCEDVSIYSFSNQVLKIPARRGFALRDAIDKSQGHGGTDTGMAMKYINENEKYDRIILITDEQSHTAIPSPKGKGYIINVGTHENGIGYNGGWTHISGWSDSVLDFIVESEKSKQ